MTFSNKQKKYLVSVKNDLFSIAAQPEGFYSKTKSRYNFCLHESCSPENLHESIRISALNYFKARNIGWHDGVLGEPSNHLCCSQCACINLLFPYMNEPELLKNILTQMGYKVKRVLMFSGDLNDGYIAFEWIGLKNYLNELERGKIAGNKRSRGKGFTSADFSILFEREDGKIELVLGEWKYTEQYRGKGSIRFSKSKTDRLSIYGPFLTCNQAINVSPYSYDILFYDPIDQLMRLQLLAKEMEKHREMNADIVSVLHIVPKANKELMEYIPNPELKSFGVNIHQVWNKIAEKDKFKGYYTEDLISALSKNAPNAGWLEYIQKRYKI